MAMALKDEDLQAYKSHCHCEFPALFLRCIFAIGVLLSSPLLLVFAGFVVGCLFLFVENLAKTFQESFKTTRKRHPKQGLLIAQCSLCLVEAGASPSIALSPLYLPPPGEPSDISTDASSILGIGMPDTSHALSNLMHKLVLADLDPATAKLAIGFLGPFFSLFSFLFIIRIVMSWYPKIPVGKFPYVVAYAPTEPLLIPTRKLIPPLGGVDVTPVVWFGFISFLNEILVGPQGLLVLLSQQVNT